MIIAPKIDTNNCRCITPALNFLEQCTHLEIQMLNPDLMSEFESSLPLLDRFPNIQYVCFHVPFDVVNLGYVMCSMDRYIQLNNLFGAVLEYTAERDVSIDILYHLRTTTFEFLDLGGEPFLSEIDEQLRGSRVRLMLENSVMNLNVPLKQADAIDYCFEHNTYSNIVACLDVCHLHLSERIWGAASDFSAEYVSAIKNIHFSFVDTSHLYYKDMGHSDPHPDVNAVIRDIEYLKSKGISLDGLCFVLEVMEDDYVNRPNLRHELGLLDLYVKMQS